MPATSPVVPDDDLTPTARDAVDKIERLTYSVDEALVVLGIGRPTFYAELVNTGRLHTVKVGGRRLVPRAAIDALLASASDATA